MYFYHEVNVNAIFLLVTIVNLLIKKCSAFRGTKGSLPCLPSGLFPSDFLTKILYAFLISYVCAAYPVQLHSPGFDHPVSTQ
jgi:hypothetical protein